MVVWVSPIIVVLKRNFRKLKYNKYFTTTILQEVYDTPNKNAYLAASIPRYFITSIVLLEVVEQPLIPKLIMIKKCIL